MAYVSHQYATLKQPPLEGEKKNKTKQNKTLYSFKSHHHKTPFFFIQTVTKRSHISEIPDGGTPLNNPLIDFCALLSKRKLHF